MPSSNVGTLYVVSTPLGCLSDMSQRAIDTLKSVDLILAEDTRHSGHLLKHYQISTPCQSYHRFNERERCDAAIKRLNQGQSLAVISDAGTPGIQDPGAILVQAALQQQLTVVPVPGPSALAAALSVCGWPVEQALFVGFLPSQTASRCRSIRLLKDQAATLVFYEAPHRLQAMVDDALSILGDRQCTLTREITKAYEQIKLLSLSSLKAALVSGEVLARGEVTLLIEGADQTVELIPDEVIAITRLLSAHMSLKAAARQVSGVYGLKINRLFQAAEDSSV